MEVSHKLTLYVSYYLSRFDKLALENLGYETWNSAFEDIGSKLNVNTHSVKNWRDEFDPIHEHRAGWHQRPMSPSRVQVVKALEALEEEEIRGIVINILSGRIQDDYENINELLKVVSGFKETKERKFILRGPTGKKAEEFFIRLFEEGKSPFNGVLFDTRDLGSGSDFEIQDGDFRYFIEVKGLAQQSGGIVFTNKEWSKAKESGESYFLAVVSNINNFPRIDFYRNPAKLLSPKMNIVTTIQTQWSVKEKDLKSLLRSEGNNGPK